MGCRQSRCSTSIGTKGTATTATVTRAERKVLEAIAQAEAGATRVDLLQVGCRDAGATQLADMLRENATVKDMNLYSNGIGGHQNEVQEL